MGIAELYAEEKKTYAAVVKAREENRGGSRKILAAEGAWRVALQARRRAFTADEVRTHLQGVGAQAAEVKRAKGR